MPKQAALEPCHRGRSINLSCGFGVPFVVKQPSFKVRSRGTRYVVQPAVFTYPPLAELPRSIHSRSRFFFLVFFYSCHDDDMCLMLKAVLVV